MTLSYVLSKNEESALSLESILYQRKKLHKFTLLGACKQMLAIQYSKTTVFTKSHSFLNCFPCLAWLNFCTFTDTLII